LNGSHINVFVNGDDSSLWNVWFGGTNWHGFDQRLKPAEAMGGPIKGRHTNSG
jgi:hypothetical protein